MNTLATLTPRLAVLAGLVERHPELPAPNVEICSVFTDRITMAFHDRPGAFRQWLTALGIAQHTVEGRAGGNTTWLTVLHEVDGITLKLTSYTRLAATVETGGEG
ncbi:hypothetical protein OIM90_11115 [Streptomyces sp. AD16]|uniref:hypothetical protein n=1 Tax=Streptomyces sp. OUCMDZ-3434 TaxID=1535304 RepID=UPI001E3A43EF|nr:hypothetical protein [Streptomyces sp. OUCMDZ-3434]WDV31663.1 hypothetical protein OIM90_11115 [Streptomyces sp. AD16]